MFSDLPRSPCAQAAKTMLVSALCRMDSFLSRYISDYEELATKLKFSFNPLRERFVIINHFD